MDSGFWGKTRGVMLTDDMVRSFRRQYARRLAGGEKRRDVEADLTRVIGNSRETVRMMLRGESYKWVGEWSEDELAERSGK